MFHVGIGKFFIAFGIIQRILPCMKLITFFQRVWDQGGPISFLGSKTRYFPVWPSKMLVCSNNITIYHALTCSPKLMRLSVASWDRLQMAVPIGSSHLSVMTWMGIAFTHHRTSRVSPIEEPQTAESLYPRHWWSLLLWKNWRNIQNFICKCCR